MAFYLNLFCWISSVNYGQTNFNEVFLTGPEFWTETSLDLQLSTNDKLFTKITAAFGLRPDKAKGYTLYNFFPVFRSGIKVWEESNTNTPPIQLMKPKVDRKQIHEFGNNTINKLIALHFTTSNKFFKMWESLQGLKSSQTLEFWINLASNLPRMGVIAK